MIERLLSLRRETIRGLRASPISGDSKKAHIELVSQLNQIIPDFKSTQVYQWHKNSSPVVNRTALAVVRHKDNFGPVILIDERVVRQDKNTDEYKRFVFVNEPDSEWNIMNSTRIPTPRDFLQKVIAHEYAHLNDQEGLGVVGREPYAYWFSEVTTGFTSLFLSFRNEYGALGEDFEEQEKIYDKLHAATKQLGVQGTIANLKSILTSKTDFVKED